METKSEILKQAAATLRNQQTQIKELLEKVAREEAAEKVLQKLLETESISPEEILNKLAELKEKTLDDLVVMEKAAEMYQNGLFTGIGKLSDHMDTASAGDAKDRMHAFLLEGE